MRIDDIAGSDIVIVTAGRVRKPGEHREDLYLDNAPTVRKIAADIRRLAPGAIVINVVEPIDLLTLLIQETLQADRFKVMGVGGLLTATRIRYLVSSTLGVSPREVTGLIIGPHHPSMVFLRDTIRVSGIPAADPAGRAAPRPVDRGGAERGRHDPAAFPALDFVLCLRRRGGGAGGGDRPQHPGPPAGLGPLRGRIWRERPGDRRAGLRRRDRA